jgi:uncharacterized Zn-binding protein involved in type VI secretion
MPPAARITDPVVHPLPPVLTPGPGSLNTLIGFLPAWRAIPAAAAAGLQAAKAASDIALQTAAAATLAAAGTPGAPAAKAAEELVKTQQLAQMSSSIMSAAGGADIHACVTPLPIPPHGPGVVIDGSPTVLINNLPASRMGDTIMEAIGPPNKIAMGCPTVIIGNTGSGGGGGGGGSAGTPAVATPVESPHDPASSDKGGGEMSNTPFKQPTSSFPGGGAGGGSSTPSTPAASALKSAAQYATPLVECDTGCTALTDAAK